MAVWLARAGRQGEHEQTALDQGIAAIGWLDMPDMGSAQDREAVTELYRQTYPDSSTKTMRNHVAQLWAFRGRIQAGDLIVLPLKTQSAIAIGKATGPYQYRTDLGDSIRHTRPVEWSVTDLPRTSFDQDLLYLFGAFISSVRTNLCPIRCPSLAIL